MGAYYWTALAPDIVNSGGVGVGGGTGIGFSIDIIGSSACQIAVGSYMSVPQHEAGNADFSFPYIAVGAQVNLYSATYLTVHHSLSTRMLS